MKKTIYGMDESPREALDEQIEFACSRCKKLFWFGVFFGAIKDVNPTEMDATRERLVKDMTQKAIIAVSDTCPNHAKEFEWK